MTEFQKYILINHPDPDSLIGTVHAFDQICRLAESYALSKVKNNVVLADVSQQRELLVAYEKQHYTPSEWALASKQCEKEIDDFLATNCG